MGEKLLWEAMLFYGLPGQYAYAGYMPNKPSYVAKAIPARGSDEEKVSWLLPHYCEGSTQQAALHTYRVLMPSLHVCIIKARQVHLQAISPQHIRLLTACQHT